MSQTQTSKAMIDWQYKTLLGELQQLQLHASDPDCPCNLVQAGEYCIPKHALNVATLAAETAPMLSAAGERSVLEDLQEAADQLHHKTKSCIVCGHCPEDIDVIDWAREWRKKVEALYYVCDAKGNPHSAAELESRIAGLEETLAASPARKLVKYIKRAGHYKGELVDLTPGQYQELTGRAPRKAIIHSKTGKVPWEWALDDIATELGYPSDEALKNEVEKLHQVMLEIEDLKTQLGAQQEKEAEGFTCGPLIHTQTVCTESVHGDTCQAKVVECTGLDAMAVRHPSGWDIHMVKEGEHPSDENKVGEVRYAKEARSVLKQVSAGIVERYGKGNPASTMKRNPGDSKPLRTETLDGEVRIYKESSEFHAGSFRTIKPDEETLVLVGCPVDRAAWQKGECVCLATGERGCMELHSVTKFG